MPKAWQRLVNVRREGQAARILARTIVVDLAKKLMT
jgi:hypothetical protein